MNSSQQMLKSMTTTAIANITPLEEATIDYNLQVIAKLPMFVALSQDEINEVSAALKADNSIKLDTGILLQEKGHQKWFLAKKASLDMKYWSRYRMYLQNDKNFSANVINKMDDILDTLTDLLGDPSRSISYNRKGLIIGDVQSGKTANYTGLICKAVDSGYKVIVLLTGTIEKLRQQTQKRIDEGFVGADSDAMMRKAEDQIIIGVGKYDPSIRPMVLTSTQDDFKQKNAQNLNFDLRNINGPVIFVVKKNVSVLKRLNKWLKSVNQVINESLLVIDDESDNASVNTRVDGDPTAINGQIRDLLNAFTKSSYVGFTATPYANIFIDPYTEHDMYQEDLFPKDYIYSLNAPSNYIGARNIFSDGADHADMLVEINCDPNNACSIEAILPLRHKPSSFPTKLPDDLKTAIEAFILANTVEDLDGRVGTHRSMLVNISRFTDVQDQIAVMVNAYVKNLQESCRLYCKLPAVSAEKDPYISALKNTYYTIYPNVNYSWETILTTLYKSCASIVVQAINRRNGQKLNFDDYPEGLRLIAVGGMSLSRGLTLEGLVISYFYRNSKMYDTLMQMGRWFGYRNGYEKLCRIWMSEESIEWYRYISDATDELRSDIKQYEDTGLTPKDFGLRVRSDTAALLVTAYNKMRSTEKRECTISLSAKYIETPEIYFDEKKNDANRKAVEKLLEKLRDNQYHVENLNPKRATHLGFRNVPLSYVYSLLAELDISPKNVHFNTASLCSFFQNYSGTELDKWDIAFVSGDSKKEKVDFSNIMPGLVYSAPVRNYSIEYKGLVLKMSGSKRRLGNVSMGQLGLTLEDTEMVRPKAGKSPQMEDYFSQINRRPLLLVYVIELTDDKPVDADRSLSVEEVEQLRADCERRHFLGFGIGIPRLSNTESRWVKYVLNKVALQQIYEGEIDDWDDNEEEFD